MGNCSQNSWRSSNLIKNCSRAVQELFFNVQEQFLNVEEPFKNCSWTVFELLQLFPQQFFSSSRTVSAALEQFKSQNSSRTVEQVQNAAKYCTKCCTNELPRRFPKPKVASSTILEQFLNSSRDEQSLNCFWKVLELFWKCSWKVEVVIKNCLRTVHFLNCSRTVQQQFKNSYRTVQEGLKNKSRTFQELFLTVEKPFLNCFWTVLDKDWTCSTVLQTVFNSSWTVYELFLSSSRNEQFLNSFWIVFGQFLNCSSTVQEQFFHSSWNAL